MRVQPYGNSDGSDKGDYHRKWEAAINSKKKKAKYMDPLSKLRCLSPSVSHPNSLWMSCFAIYQPFLWNSIWYMHPNLAPKMHTNTKPVWFPHSTMLEPRRKARSESVDTTLCGSLASCRGGGGERGWSSSVYLSPTPPTPLPSLPPLATWHTLWLICQCAGIIGAGHAWCVRDRMSR